ncbi:hypothetical protein [Actinokineospora diospyrosa]|uniref:Uncharacterized protein n=1 Tax=Actinokineospora diospyrosa TaxID=103728 RepID=A0ABT1IKH4_9PSEU|nr:hypothetical protein [Actinokineospora diospyrosa]MCP2272716.1 hypothetical protein [Actinokineospora diospyrosa]
MIRRWVLALTTIVGVALLGVALLVLRVAEEALGPAPEVRGSAWGSLSACGIQPGMTDCDPPELSAGTVTVIVVLAVAGLCALAAVAVDVERRRQTARPGFERRR